MEARIFIHGSNHLIVPPQGTPYIVSAEWDTFIRPVGAEEALAYIDKNLSKEIVYKIQPELPVVPLWNHIKGLSGRSNDPRINKECRHSDHSIKEWWGFPQSKLEFYVRSNFGIIEFLVLYLEPKPNTYYDKEEPYDDEVIDASIIGAREPFIGKVCHNPNKPIPSEFILDEVGELIETPERSILSYTTSRNEFLTLLEDAFGRKLTAKEVGSVGEDYSPPSAFRADNITYRPDIWN